MVITRVKAIILKYANEGVGKSESNPKKNFHVAGVILQVSNSLRDPESDPNNLPYLLELLTRQAMQKNCLRRRINKFQAYYCEVDIHSSQSTSLN